MPPNALARPGSCPRCDPTIWNFVRPTTSCLVGGYAHTEVPGQAIDDQANLQSGASPAPYPFETEVVVTIGSKEYSFQGSVQGACFGPCFGPDRVHPGRRSPHTRALLWVKAHVRPARFFSCRAGHGRPVHLARVLLFGFRLTSSGPPAFSRAGPDTDGPFT